MKLRFLVGAVSVAALAACGGGQTPETSPPAAPPAATPAGTPGAAAAPGTPAAQPGAGAQIQGGLRCEPSPRMPVEGRPSPYDSTRIAIGNREALVCYGRPEARGRTMIGGDAVPFGRLWRTGANEPTILHIPFAAQVAGINVEPGAYSLYTIPGEREWTVIVNRSTAQWGHESAYTEAVRAQEVGRATVPAERVGQHVESFTIRSEPAGGNRADMVLEWENTRVRIPVAAR
jgi:hypothetical protein